MRPMTSEELAAELRKRNPALLAAQVEYLTKISDRAAEMHAEQFPDVPLTDHFLIGAYFGTVACLEVTAERGGLRDLGGGEWPS